jgi:DNA-binding transcriptional regulator YiaG
MGFGYSLITVSEIQNANPSLLGVKLAKVCLKNNIPVKDVAEFFGVTRMTVYNWFKGKVVVSGKHAERMLKLIDKLK